MLLKVETYVKFHIRVLKIFANAIFTFKFAFNMKLKVLAIVRQTLFPVTFCPFKQPCSIALQLQQDESSRPNKVSTLK